MQLNFFEDMELLHDRIKFVAIKIIRSDSIRGYIKKSIKNQDRNELTKLFGESIRTFGFGGHDYDDTTWSWSFGKLKGDNGEEHKITARQLADLSLSLWGGYEWQNHDG